MEKQSGSPSAEDAVADEFRTQFAGQDRYELREEIARGGMGIVLRAYDRVLCRPVAVKVELVTAGPDEGLRRRFQDEARLAARLAHPAIVPIHDVGVLPNGRLFLAMKLVQGQTLATILAADPCREDAANHLRVFVQVCQAIAYAHSRGVIHRDLKPSNIMVGAFGEVQVMDWGLALDLAARRGAPDGAAPTADVARTRTGAVMGTPAYMAPEQARGEEADERSDVFGLGAILCEILTGVPPFASLGQVQAGSTQEALGRLPDEMESRAARLARRCLDARPQDRPCASVVARDAALCVDQLHAREEVSRAAREAAAKPPAAFHRSWVFFGLLAATATAMTAAAVLSTLSWRQAAIEDERQARDAAEARAAAEIEVARKAWRAATRHGTEAAWDAAWVALAKAKEAAADMAAPQAQYQAAEELGRGLAKEYRAAQGGRGKKP